MHRIKRVLTANHILVPSGTVSRIRRKRLCQSAAASEEKLFILDPHFVQPQLAIDNVDKQISQPYMMGMRWPRLNSSMSLGFFVRHMEDFDAVAAADQRTTLALIYQLYT